MEFLRIVLAISIFLLGCYLIYDLIIYGFNWMMLLSVFISFTVANFFWPKERKEKDSLENSLDFVDLLEFVITLPFRAVAMSLRAVGKIGKEVDSVDL